MLLKLLSIGASCQQFYTLDFKKVYFYFFVPKVEELSCSGTEPGMPELTLASLLWA